jgi:hypothetical protein
MDLKRATYYTLFILTKKVLSLVTCLLMLPFCSLDALFLAVGYGEVAREDNILGYVPLNHFVLLDASPSEEMAAPVGHLKVLIMEV